MSEPAPARTLARSIGFTTLVLYGLGTIIGAGIYVLVGEVAGAAGMRTPLAFAVAGVLAALTGLSYAELTARHPAAEGTVAFVQAAFGKRWLSRLVGAALGVVLLTGAATITLGGAGYLAAAVPAPVPVIAASVVVLFTGIACLHVKNSASTAAIMSAIELGGIAFVFAVGSPALAHLPANLPAMIPAGSSEALGLLAGTLIAFYAFLGFESMANMAEETHDPGHTMPRAILASIAISAVLYAGVALVTILDVPLAELATSASPLLLVVARHAPQFSTAFQAVAVIATLNGVLIEILVVARLGYGMAARGHLPHWFGTLHATTHAPVRTTLVVGAILMALVTVVPFSLLARVTSGITLAIFVAVNLSLWTLQRHEPRPELTTRVPHWVPLAGAAACGLLLAGSVLG